MKRSNRKAIKDYLVTISIAVGMAVFIRSFVIEAYRVPNTAMKPTLISGDTLFVAKWPFSFAKSYQPKRGDIVVFTMPVEQEGTSLDFIKRIVGLPGDQIEIKDGRVYLNGLKLSIEPQSPNQPQTETRPETQPETRIEDCPSEAFSDGTKYNVCLGTLSFQTSSVEKVPADSVFVVGDFRADPPNSRADKKSRRGWGIVPISSIQGKALWIWLSIEYPKSDKALPIPSLRWDRMFRRIQ